MAHGLPTATLPTKTVAILTIAREMVFRFHRPVAGDDRMH
jgi:hypothetical protein